MDEDYMTKVSVIIPYYFGSRDFVEYCFNSVMAQTFRDFEVLIVTDDPLPFTPKSRGVPVRVLENQTGKKGASVTRNLGLENSEGRYVKTLDADDAIFPSYLGECVKALDERPDVGLVYTDYDLIDNKNHFLREKKAPDFDLSKFLETNFVGSLTVMFRRNGFRFNEEMDEWEDYELWLRVARKYPFFHIPKTLASYRVHEGQQSKHIQHSERNIVHIDERRKEIRGL